MVSNWKGLIDLVDEIRRCDDNNITTASIAMSYICIDTLANLSRPLEKAKATRSDFINWVNNYLTAHPDQQYNYRGKDVYAARCALLHKLGSEAELHEQDHDILIFGYHNGGMHYLDHCKDSRLVLIGTKSFIDDIVAAVTKFMDACKESPDLMALVESRLGKVLNKVPISKSINNSHALREEDAIVGEDVIVDKPNSPMHKKIGQIWKINKERNQPRINVSFEGDIYSFDLEELSLA